MLKLNLGCGRFPFPLDRDHVPNPEHLNDLPAMVFEPGWVNVDKFAFDGVTPANLFRVPWPLDDNAFDVVWIGHLVEHIPHEIKSISQAEYNIMCGRKHEIPSVVPETYRMMCENLDGFFVFMYECWRVMKPGAIVYIRAPLSVSYPSLSDPTHTRYLTPGTFGYLAAPAPETPFDYHIPCRFEIADPSRPYLLRLRGDYARQADNYTDKGLSDLIMKYNNVADEFRIELRAIKE